jgi:outer membrane receptor for Fe3+-dicitrate
MRGVGYLPSTGGLLLGDGGTEGEGNRFPISQDQRHTVRGRAGYDLTSRAWVALAGSYGSGLPVEQEGDLAAAVEQYGPRTLSRVDFARGRVKSCWSLDASASVLLAKANDRSLRLQVDVINLTNHFNVVNFAGLFSGTALGAPRTLAIRLEATF